MCNLNLYFKSKNFKLDEEKTYKLLSFMMATTSNSYSSNKDGDGIFFNGIQKGCLIRHKNKIPLLKYRKELVLSSTTISHQRISTSGMSDKYIQPFKMGDFVLAHNGIMTKLEEGDKSDTYVFFERFIKYFKRDKHKKRDKKIYHSIKRILSEVNYTGTYSMVLYDIKTGASYYFKNSGRSIYWYLNKDMNLLYITTNSNNECFLEMVKEGFKEFKVEKDILYKIEPRDKTIEITEIEKIEEPPKKVVKTSGQDGWSRDEDYEKEAWGDYVVTKAKVNCECAFCGIHTTSYDHNRKVFICDLCLFDGLQTEFDDILNYAPQEDPKNIAKWAGDRWLI